MAWPITWVMTPIQCLRLPAAKPPLPGAINQFSASPGARVLDNSSTRAERSAKVSTVGALYFILIFLR